jgi:hypothetical protein
MLDRRLCFAKPIQLCEKPMTSFSGESDKGGASVNQALPSGLSKQRAQCSTLAITIGPDHKEHRLCEAFRFEPVLLRPLR